MPRGILSFYNHYFFIILHGVYGAKKPGRPGSDNNQIVVFGSRQKRIPLAVFTYIIWLSSDFFMKFCQRNHSTILATVIIWSILFGLTYLSCFINSCLLLLNERY